MRLAMLGWGSVSGEPGALASPVRPAGLPVPLERARRRGAGVVTGFVPPIPQTALPRTLATAVAYLRGLPPTGRLRAVAYLGRLPATLQTPIRQALAAATDPPVGPPAGDSAPGC